MNELINKTFSIEPRVQSIYTKRVSVELPLMEKLKGKIKYTIVNGNVVYEEA